MELQLRASRQMTSNFERLHAEQRQFVWRQPEYELRGGGCGNSRPKATIVCLGDKPIHETRLLNASDALREFSEPDASPELFQSALAQLKQAHFSTPEDVPVMISRLLQVLESYVKQGYSPRCLLKTARVCAYLLCLMFVQQPSDVTELAIKVARLKNEIVIASLIGSKELLYYLEVCAELLELLTYRPHPVLEYLTRVAAGFFSSSSKSAEYLTSREWQDLQQLKFSDRLLGFLDMRQRLFQFERQPSSLDACVYCLDTYSGLPLIVFLHEFAPILRDRAVFGKLTGVLYSACSDEALRCPALFVILSLAGQETPVPVPDFKTEVLSFLETRRHEYLNSSDIFFKGLVLQAETYMNLLCKYLTNPTEIEEFWINLWGLHPRFYYSYLDEVSLKFPEEANAYLNLEVTEDSPVCENKHPIDRRIQQFLEDPVHRICIVLGEAGSGKTLYTFKLRSQFVAGGMNWLPLYIYLPYWQECRGTIFKKAFEDASLNYAAPIMEHRKVLFLLDSHDEVTMPVNFLAESRVLQQLPQAKVVVTCRTSYVRSFNIFLPGIPRGGLQMPFTRLYICPLTETKIQEYLKQQRGRGAAAAWDLIQELGLREMLENPCKLAICMKQKGTLEALQQVDGPIHLHHVYEKFIEVFQSQAMERTHPREAEHEIRSSFERKTTDYAFTAFDNLVIDLHQEAGKSLQTEEREMIVEGCPIVPVDGHTTRRQKDYQFQHRSIMEYMVAKTLVSELTASHPNTLSDQAVINYYDLGSQSNVRKFVVEMIQYQKPMMEPLLIDIVMQSRHRKDITQASTNALTLLHQIGFCFSNHDFSGVTCPGAKLVGANLTKANFAGSILVNGDFRNASLTHTNLQDTNLAGARFGKKPALKSHSDEITAVRFSPNGSLFASSSRDKTAVLWDTVSGQPLHTLQGHSQEVTAVAFSPDGNHLASSSLDKSIILWDLQTGRSVRTMKSSQKSFHSLSFSPTEPIIASGDNYRTVTLWDIRSGNEMHMFRDHSSDVSAVIYSPDGKQIVSGTKDGTLTMWHVESRSQMYVFQGHSETVTGLSFAPNGKLFASSSYDKSVALWDPATGTQTQLLYTHSDWVTDVCFSPDGVCLVSGSNDQSVIVWELATGRVIRTFLGHTAGISAVAWSSDASLILSGSFDCTLMVWETEECPQEVAGAIHSEEITAVVMSNALIVSASHDGSVLALDFESRQPVQVFSGHNLSVNSVDMSPDGQYVASGSSDKTVRIWEVKSGKKVRDLEGHSDWVASVSFSPDGRTLASGSGDNTVILWKLATGQQERVLRGHEQSLTNVRFSPNGKLLASGSSDRKVILWDLTSFQEVLKLEEHSKRVSAVCFSPNTEQLASASWDKQVIVCGIPNGNKLHTLTGHSSYVTSVQYSPDGHLIASGSFDCTIMLWEAANGQKLRMLQGHSGTVSGVCFSSDDSMLVSSSWDRTIVVWELTPESPVERHAVPGFYSKDLRQVVFQGETRTGCWNVENGQAQGQEEVSKGPVVEYVRPESKVLAVFGYRGLTCFGVQLEGAVLSKYNLDLLNSLSKKVTN